MRGVLKYPKLGDQKEDEGVINAIGAEDNALIHEDDGEIHKTRVDTRKKMCRIAQHSTAQHSTAQHSTAQH